MGEVQKRCEYQICASYYRSTQGGSILLTKTNEIIFNGACRHVLRLYDSQTGIWVKC